MWGLENRFCRVKKTPQPGLNLTYTGKKAYSEYEHNDLRDLLTDLDGFNDFVNSFLFFLPIPGLEKPKKVYPKIVHSLK